MKARFTTILAAMAVAVSGMAAEAKPLSRIIAEMGLSPDDFNVVNATADAMFEGGTPQVGTERAWSNADSGSQGTIRVEDVKDNCVYLQHVVQPGDTDQTREVRTRRCRTAEGNWILTP